jgi:hypothetical protein
LAAATRWSCTRWRDGADPANAVGLDDSYGAADRGDLMFGFLVNGERRLPDATAQTLLAGVDDGLTL